MVNPIWRLVLSVFIVASLVLWTIFQFRYRIRKGHLEVTLLGLCVRRIPLGDIRYISKRRTALAENWWNTLFPRKRTLVIHRRTGWFRNFVITPKHRYAFKTELDRARRQVADPPEEKSLENV